MIGQHARELVQAGFRGGVGEGFQRGHAQAVDGADVDDSAGGGGGGGGFEKGRQGLGYGEDAGEVQREHACPC